MSKAAKVISNTVYGIGVLIVIALGGIALFGSSQPANPDAMLPFSWKELAFIWLMFGSVPMLLACMAVYMFNEIKNSPNRKRNFFFIFLPGFICSACALYAICMLLYKFLSYILLR